MSHGAQWGAKCIGCVLPHEISPPIELDAALGHLESEEDEDNTNSDASVQSSRQNVVVPHPPAEVVSAHEPLEDKADHNPGGVVNSGCGRHRTDACEEHGDVDIPPVGEWEATGKIVERDGKDCADEEEPEQWTVHRTGAEQTVRADASPNQGRRSKHIRRGTYEMLGLVGLADVDDIGKHPVLHRRHHDAADEGSNDLGEVHETGRDLHVVAEFQIAGEVNCLTSAGEGGCLENHDRYGPPRQEVATEKFVHDV